MHMPPAVMTGTWIAENVENVKPDFQIDVATVKVTNEPVTNFSLTNSKGDGRRGSTGWRSETMDNWCIRRASRFVSARFAKGERLLPTLSAPQLPAPAVAA